MSLKTWKVYQSFLSPGSLEERLFEDLHDGHLHAFFTTETWWLLLWGLCTYYILTKVELSLAPLSRHTRSLPESDNNARIRDREHVKQVLNVCLVLSLHPGASLCHLRVELCRIAIFVVQNSQTSAISLEKRMCSGSRIFWIFWIIFYFDLYIFLPF